MAKGKAKPKVSRRARRPRRSSSSSSSLATPKSIADSFFGKNKYEKRPKFCKKFGPLVQRFFDDANKVRIGTKPLIATSRKGVRRNLDKTKPLAVEAIAAAQDIIDESAKFAEVVGQTVMWYDPSMKTLTADFCDRGDKALIIGANVVQDGVQFAAYGAAKAMKISSALARRLLKKKNLKQFTDFSEHMTGAACDQGTLLIRRLGPALKAGTSAAITCAIEIVKVSVGTGRAVTMKINALLKAFPIKLRPLSDHLQIPLINGTLARMLGKNKLRIFIGSLPALLNDVNFSKYLFKGASKEFFGMAQDISSRELPGPIHKFGRLAQTTSHFSGKQSAYAVKKMKKDPKGMQDFNKYAPNKQFGHFRRTYNSNLSYKKKGSRKQAAAKGKKKDQQSQSTSQSTSSDSSSQDTSFDTDSSSDMDSQSDSYSEY